MTQRTAIDTVRRYHQAWTSGDGNLFDPMSFGPPPPNPDA